MELTSLGEFGLIDLIKIPAYQPEQLVGKTVVACTNLPPRKMMGQMSNGMLLSAEKDGVLNLVMLDDKVPAGAKL